MFIAHIASSIFIMALSAALLFWIIPAQTPPYPGYGMPASLLPDIMASIMLACAAADLAKTLLTRAGAGKPFPISAAAFLKCAAIVIVLAASMPLMNLLGYAAGGCIVMAACCLLCGERKWLRLAVVSGASVLIVWAVLWKGLSIMLP